MPTAPSNPVDDSLLQRLNQALGDRYHVERRLGEGGMATVWLARDLRHARQVAIKVLRPELAAVVGGERFLAEIQTTANLQHPHILPLHDSGAAEGFLFYVMPYVAGESLREKLEREKQLTVGEALALTRKVADALDYAHAKGVVHRDIKPANILLSERGEPLVADFGIALAVSQAGGGRITETGLSLGTPHYMSPEQATGDRDVDPRSDVYALACVLYEMLAGQPPFAAPTAQAVLARILTEDARRVTELRRTVPSHVAAVLARGLEKLPADRFASAAAFRDALDDESFTYASTPRPGTSTLAVPAPVAERDGPGRRTWLVTAGIGAALAVLAAWGWLRPQAAPAVRRFAVVIDSAGPGFGPSAVLSPDGTRLVFIGADQQLWIRPLGSLDARPIPETSGGRTPFFSPDGDDIGFHTGAGGTGDGRIFTVSLNGSPPVQLAAAASGIYPGGSWSDDGWVYFVDPPGNLLRVRSQGGPVETVMDSSSGYWFSWPEALPGGDVVLATAWPRDGEVPAGVAAVDPTSGAATPILPGLTGAQQPDMVRYAGGYLFWSTAGRTLMAAPFDPGSLELTGAPVALASNLLAAAPRAHEFDVADDGTLTYVLGGSDLSRNAGNGLGENAAWVERNGEATILDTRLSQDAGDFDHLSLSPDGRYIAAEIQNGGDGTESEEHQVWIYDISQATLVRLTLDGTWNTQPRWLDEGTVVYLSARREEGTALYAQAIDDRTPREFLRPGREILQFDLGEPGGPVALVLAGEGDEGPDVVAARPGAGTIEGSIASTRFGESGVDVSPDGRWIAYTSDESGRPEAYVSPFPGGGRGRAVSTTGGSLPRWGADGDELFYVGADNRLMVAELDIGDQVRVASRSPLFDLTPFEPGVDGFASYDVAPDGDRLLMIAEAGGGAAGRRIVVLNVFEELDPARARGGRPR